LRADGSSATIKSGDDTGLKGGRVRWRLAEAMLVLVMPLGAEGPLEAEFNER